MKKPEERKPLLIEEQNKTYIRLFFRKHVIREGSEILKVLGGEKTPTYSSMPSEIILQK